MFKSMFKTFFILFAMVFTSATMAEDNALTAALPDVTKLSVEKCSENQSKMLESLGLGQMACTLSKHISFDSISKAIGTSAFQPNSRSNPLNPSDNVEDFVRYSPRFFTRLNELYVKDTDSFVYSFLYKNFLTNSTRIFYMTGNELRESKKLNNLTLAQYKEAANDSKSLNKDAIAVCKNTQAAITKAYGASYKETFKQCGKSGTASLFWYRRQLDGSNDALFHLLDTILKTQDQEFYSQFRLVAAKTLPKKTGASH